MIWDLDTFGDAAALAADGRTVSYRELADACRGIADAIGGRSLVFSLCSNAPGSIAGYLACVNGGAVPLLLEESLNRRLLDALVECYRPSFIWVPEGREGEFPQWRCVHRALGYALLASPGGEPYPLHPDLALLVSTSGSTGTPKLVRLSSGNIASNTEAIAEYLGITSAERAITSLPMSYVYGLSVVNTHISQGATLVLTDSPCYVGAFWKLFEEQRCTSFAGVPFMYEMLDKLRFTRKDPPAALRTMTQAGGRLSPELQARFVPFANGHGIDFVIMYGASEATARMSYLPPDRAEEKSGSIGIPVPGGRLAVLDDVGREVAEPGQVGELAYFGPNVSLGYATQGDDLAKGDENGGRLLTGDLARFDDEGYFYIAGRKKRFVKILGKRTNLDDVESLLKGAFDTVDVACAGVDDLLGVFVVDPALVDAASRYVHETMGINEKLVSVQLVDEIPKNQSGKTLYSKLNQMVSERKA